MNPDVKAYIERITSPICRAHDQRAGSSSRQLRRGGEYNFRNQPERLKYLGKRGNWHQFEKIGERGVWCELLDSDLCLIEETRAV
ncbi:MAG: hypothetical protein CMN85_10410 [Spongiibacteraceae bacterium]|nr:hypothetical protein [Spongiibacteraceae bacterium]|tara:strand:+ start:6385 stop:6639 length:255 start_codon:yes stop_codon:yes gene_type:complete